MKQTVDEFVRFVEDAGERISSGELTAINDEIATIANTAQQEKVKNVLDVQLLLKNIKDSIKAICITFRPAYEIIRDHLKRSLEARNAVSEALEATLIKNDSESNVISILLS